MARKTKPAPNTAAQMAERDRQRRAAAAASAKADKAAPLAIAPEAPLTSVMPAKGKGSPRQEAAQPTAAPAMAAPAQMMRPSLDPVSFGHIGLEIFAVAPIPGARHDHATAWRAICIGLAQGRLTIVPVATAEPEAA